jgi:hypothetical protein
MVSVSGMTRNDRLLQTPLQRVADGFDAPLAKALHLADPTDDILVR